MLQPEVLIKRLDPRAELPSYKSAEAAGMDLSACLPESVVDMLLEPGQIVLVPTGIAIAIPVGYEGQVRARSGLASKHGITPVNGPGTIDSDYRGELKVALVNLGREPYLIAHGARVAQLVIAPVARAVLREATELNFTSRGMGGFGSTGGM